MKNNRSTWKRTRLRSQDWTSFFFIHVHPKCNHASFGCLETGQLKPTENLSQLVLTWSWASLYKPVNSTQGADSCFLPARSPKWKPSAAADGAIFSDGCPVVYWIFLWQETHGAVSNHYPLLRPIPFSIQSPDRRGIHAQWDGCCDESELVRYYQVNVLFRFAVSVLKI